MRFYFTSLALLLSITSIDAQSIPGHDAFISPIKAPLYFAGSFGEVRPNHFHAGLDYRTKGQTGLPVYATKSGYISRIAVSPRGYGNVLYLTHPDGTTTVYGHLLRFHPKIEAYVKDRQYKQESFAITLTPREDDFIFKQGEQIAWSGNSGSSGGPHLHFEIRETTTERAINPLCYHLGIEDRSAPKIKALYVYSINRSEGVVENQLPRRFEAIPVPGGYRLKNNAPIPLSGLVGFGVQADDDFSGTGLKCGIYGASLSCDEKMIFGFKLKEIAFDDTRYVNTHSDYQAHKINQRIIHRLYRQPGNHLNIYDPVVNDGIIDLRENKNHEFILTVFDALGNKAFLKFRITSGKQSPSIVSGHYNKIFKWDHTNSFENEEIKINLDKGTLYDDLGFRWKMVPSHSPFYSNIHQIQSKSVPVHKNYTLSIRCSELPKELRDKAMIVLLTGPKSTPIAIGGGYSDGWVTTPCNLFGDFAVAVDQTAPTITPLSIQNKTQLADQHKIVFRITDNLSGVKSYRGEIDGKWVLFEYDAKNDLITYTFDPNRFTSGLRHSLRLIVTDFKDNSAEYKATFIK